MTFLWIKSREERETERRIMIRRTMNDLDKCIGSRERKKGELKRIARQARAGNMDREYQTAKNGLIVLMKYTQTLEAVRMRVAIAETMRDMGGAGMKAVKTMGGIGRELRRVLERTHFARNQAAFEAGGMKMEEMMARMDGLLESTSEMTAGLGAEEKGAAWARRADALIGAAGDAPSADVDREIDGLLASAAERAGQ